MKKIETNHMRKNCSTNLELTNSTQSFINSLSLIWREVGSLLAGWAKLLAGSCVTFWRAGQKARILIHCDSITGNVFTEYGPMILGPMDGVITFFCK